MNAAASGALARSGGEPPAAAVPGAIAAGTAEALERAIGRARRGLLGLQQPEGFWVFELEADCTIPAEYILMMHFLDEIDTGLEVGLASYLRARQADHGGWPLYHGGDLDLSCSVKVYYALKLAGDGIDAPHMARARAAILERGGAARSNVFTRIALALFGQVPWRAVPYIPVEIMLLPRWFPFHLEKVSYWSRTVLVPLLILCTHRARARNPRRVEIRELFTIAPEKEQDYFRVAPERDGLLTRLFLLLDRAARRIDPLIPRRLREHATRRAEAWVQARLNAEDGLGAIFPAMVNALESMVVRGVPADDARRQGAKRALRRLLVTGALETYCQPCVSPIWDTALAVLAMQEAGDEAAGASAERALAWLRTRQLQQQPGDWQGRRPGLSGGGWAFQFANDFYPDLDDTAAIAWAMCRSGDRAAHAGSLRRALDWLVGMQSRNGGFAAFDADNTHHRLNHIPFADHGALLDPPTSDVTARVVTALASAGRAADRAALDRALEYLRAEQTAEGCWFGRWGTNYIYGTWSVLTAFAQAGIGPDDAAVRRAVDWLEARQNVDGGWGESNDSYRQSPGRLERAPSNPYQTAWALLALRAVGAGRFEVVQGGVEFLCRTQQADGLWSDPSFTAPGFPRVFYLKYHGYCAYFPFWALAACRRRAHPGAPH